MSLGRAQQRDLASGARNWLGGILAVLFVVAIPLSLIGNNVRWVTLDPNTYREGFERYRATERTGIRPEQLERIGSEFIRYFQGPAGELNPTVTIRGTAQPLFNAREVAHMVDVQALMQLVFRMGLWALLYCLAFSGGLLLWRRGEALPVLGRLLLWGSGLSFAILLSVAGLSLVDFTELFVKFHEVSFRNDLWILDPRRDYLLMLFPQGFWLDVTLKIAALTAAEAAGLGILGLWLVRVGSGRSRQ